MKIPSQHHGYPTIQVGLTVPVGHVSCSQVGLTVPGRPRTSRDADPYLDAATGAPPANRSTNQRINLHRPQVGLTVPGRPQAWGLASPRAAMACLTSCRHGPAGTLVPTSMQLGQHAVLPLPAR